MGAGGSESCRRGNTVSRVWCHAGTAMRPRICLAPPIGFSTILLFVLADAERVVVSLRSLFEHPIITRHRMFKE